MKNVIIYLNFFNLVFSKALNPDKESVGGDNKNENQPYKSQYEVTQQEGAMPEHGEENLNIPTENLTRLDSKKEEKRRKKSVQGNVLAGQIQLEGEKTEDVIETPENAMTYSEYLEMMKKKNEQLYKDNKNINSMQNINTNLNNEQLQQIPQANSEKEYQDWINSLHQKKKKPKEKKSDAREEEINRMVGRKLLLTAENEESRGNKEKFYSGNYARPVARTEKELL